MFGLSSLSLLFSEFDMKGVSHGLQINYLKFHIKSHKLMINIELQIIIYFFFLFFNSNV
jgi:hypothetical protein